MAPIDWKSLQGRLEAEATRLAEELRREAGKLAAQAQDPAVQARLRDGAREVGQQALQALEQATVAAQAALAQAQEALREQPSESTEPMPAQQPSPDFKAVGRTAAGEAGAGKQPPRAPKKTVGPRKDPNSR